MKALRVSLTLVPFLLMASGGPAAAQIVATVNKRQISLAEFKKKFDEVKGSTINPPTPEVFLEDLIRYEVGVQEADKQKVDQDPLFQEKIRQEKYKLLVEKAIGKEVNAIRINEKEMRAYYKKNPEIRTSHILIEYAPGATNEQKMDAKKRAEEIYREVKNSKRPFEELVKLYTDDSMTKNYGGDIGYQSRVTLVPTYYDTALAMKDGEIRGVIPSRYGFHIIKKTGVRSFQQANKAQIRAAVFDDKRKQIFDRYFNKLKRSYQISKDVSLVKNIE